MLGKSPRSKGNYSSEVSRIDGQSVEEWSNNRVILQSDVLNYCNIKENK